MSMSVSPVCLTLPKLPLNSHFLEKHSLKEAQDSLTGILSGNAPKNPLALVKFFKIMATDAEWLVANPLQAKDIIRAITCLYLSSDDQTILGKINRSVRDNHKNLCKVATADMRLAVCEGKHTSRISCVSLFLACQSPMFETMVRTNMSEGRNLQEFYAKLRTNPENTRVHLPRIPIGGVSIKVAKSYVSLLTEGKDPRTSLSLDEQLEFVQYVDMTQSFTSTFLKTEQIFLNHLTSEMTEDIYKIMFEKIKMGIKKQSSKAFVIDWTRANQEINKEIEDCFIKILSELNKETLQDFAKKKGFGRLLSKIETKSA